MKQLFLIRHAAAIPINPSLPDFDRTLTKEGFQEARYIGNYLKDNHYSIEYILASPALRTLETAYTIAELISYPKQAIMTHPSLYNAKLDVFLNILSELDDNLSTVALVSHNPGISILANYLNDAVNESLPTGSLAILEFSDPKWSACLTTHQSKLLKLLYSA